MLYSSLLWKSLFHPLAPATLPPITALSCPVCSAEHGSTAEPRQPPALLPEDVTLQRCFPPCAPSMTKQCLQPGTRHGKGERPSTLMDLGDLVKPWLGQKNKAGLQVAVITSPSLLLTPGFPPAWPSSVSAVEGDPGVWSFKSQMLACSLLTGFSGYLVNGGSGVSFHHP